MLTQKQQFLKVYLVDLYASAVAKRAGYFTKNSDKIVSELLVKNRLAEPKKL